MSRISRGCGSAIVLLECLGAAQMAAKAADRETAEYAAARALAARSRAAQGTPGATHGG